MAHSQSPEGLGSQLSAPGVGGEGQEASASPSGVDVWSLEQEQQQKEGVCDL